MTSSSQMLSLAAMMLVLTSCASKGVRFDSSFESGNGHQFQEVAEGVYSFELEPDTNSVDNQWFMFDVAGARGKELTFQLLNTDKTNVPGHWSHMRPVVSRDGGETWARFDGATAVEGNTYTFTHAFEKSSERLAFHYPYTFSMGLEKMEEWAAHPDATRTVLGDSIEGRTIVHFRVTDESVESDSTKRGIWVIGRQHSGEVTGSFTTEGFMDFLLSDAPEALALRRGAVVNVVPFANPDGAVAGNYRNNVAGVNLNRVWDGSATLEKSPEIVHAQRALDAWVAAGKPYDLFLDFHSTSGDGPHFAFHSNESQEPAAADDPANYFEETRAFLALVNKHCPHFHPEKGASGSADQKLAYHRQREQYGVIALTPEGTYSQVGHGPEAQEYLDPDDHREVGVGFAKAIVEMYGLGR
jgi:hypothetical protein